jgi:uncharacterized protein YndB with AHSA1/START domain
LSAPATFEETTKETAMTEPFVVRRETQIAAPPATVFAFLTDPEKILSWMGTEAETQVHPGGLYLLKGVQGRVARGAFREVVPVHRLAYSFGWDGDAEVPPGSGLIEIDLIDPRRWHPVAHGPKRPSQRSAVRRPRQGLGALPGPAHHGRRRAESRRRCPAM